MVEMVHLYPVLTIWLSLGPKWVSASGRISVLNYSHVHKNSTLYHFDIDGTIGLKDNGVNKAVSQGLAELRSAGNSVKRHPAKSLQQESEERSFIWK